MGVGGFGFCPGRGQPNKAGDRLQHSFAVAERQSELFEVAISEIGEHVRVDPVVPELALVFAEAKAAKPLADIHGRAPHGSMGIIAQRRQAVQHWNLVVARDVQEPPPNDRCCAQPTRSAYARFLVFSARTGADREGQQRVDSGRPTGFRPADETVAIWRAQVHIRPLPRTPESVRDLGCDPCPAASGRDATRVQGVGDLPQARALGSHRGDDRQDVRRQLIGGGLVSLCALGPNFGEARIA